jgi:hypothetical protein
MVFSYRGSGQITGMIARNNRSMRRVCFPALSGRRRNPVVQGISNCRQRGQYQGEEYNVKHIRKVLRFRKKFVSIYHVLPIPVK